MKIPVRLVSIEGASAARFGDDGEGVVEAADGATLLDVLDALKLPRDEPYATLVNGEPVAAKDRARRRLEPGDELTVFPPITGGRGGRTRRRPA
jgi:sulfur carrier protein ThiS